jgi:hypothetical protein
MSTPERIDSRLSRQMAAAGDGLVQVILIVGDEDDPARQPDDAGLAARVVAEASARAGQPPARVRYLPRANAAVIEARVRYLHAALDDRRVIVASATTIDIFPWG